MLIVLTSCLLSYVGRLAKLDRGPAGAPIALGERCALLVAAQVDERLDQRGHVAADDDVVVTAERR